MPVDSGVGLIECPLLSLKPERFERFVPDRAEWEALVAITLRVRHLLEGRVVWAISSRARSGGLAELLQSQVVFSRGAGIDARWAVLAASDDFFALAKLLDDDLHGEESDRTGYREGERQLYESTLDRAAGDLCEKLLPGDVVLLHDPVTAGMIPAVKDAGAVVIWRCRMGSDEPSDQARRAWRFLTPYVERADAVVFARRQFVWEGMDERRAHVIPPSVSPLSPKNQQLYDAGVEAILAAAGLQPGSGGENPVFDRLDGSPGRVDREVELIESDPLPPATLMVLHVSQWNRVKDPIGVLDWFAHHIAPRCAAHLVLTGPDLAAITDDPRAPAVLDETVAHLRELPAQVRERIHLATLPSADPEEAAAIINALQRRSAVVIQKSRGEGFGMTVLESMWKHRPVVCSRIGALQDHMIDGETGFLHDPGDLEGFAQATVSLLGDERLRQRMGAAGHERIRRNFLLPRELTDLGALIEMLVVAAPAAGAGNAEKVRA